MTKYKATLNFLFSQLPMFQRVGASAFKKDLTNIRKLCAALGNPQETFKCIHIAGTNGKGSTAHLLSATMQSHGFKTGLYTSPHYRDFRERIKIDGALIPRKNIVDFVEKNKGLFEEIQPSFFEITVALAFQYFAQQKVDIAIIETGLGGRLDSTNIITPLLSIITNISFDHQQFLGDTLPLIAGEKAGIIKQGIPVVIGEMQEETKEVFVEKARSVHAEITFAENYIKVKENYHIINKEEVKKPHLLTHSHFDVFRNKEQIFKDLDVNLIGKYQAKNLTTVLHSLSILESIWEDFSLEEKKLRHAFSNLKTLTNFIGRWHLLGTQPNIIADSAHNVAGLTLTMQQLEKISYEKLHIVLGMVNDKEIGKVLKLLPKNATYYFAKADIPRGMDAYELANQAHELGLKGRTYVSVNAALKAAKKAANPTDFIYVGGSTFVVAEVV